MSVASFSSSAAAAAGGGAGGGAGAGTSTRTGVQGGAGDGPRKFSSESAELAHAVAGHKTESRVLSQYLHDTATTESNRWPIIKCVRVRDDEGLAFLLDQEGKAHANDKDYRGMTALHHAAAIGNTMAIAMLLKEENIQIDIPDRAGSTPLHHAAVLDQPKVVTMLLDAGANLNAQKKNKRTPLHEAAWINHTDVLRVLLNAEADPYILEANHKTAAELARDNHADAAADMLEAHVAMLKERTYQEELQRRRMEWGGLQTYATAKRRDCGRTSPRKRAGGGGGGGSSALAAAGAAVTGVSVGASSHFVDSSDDDDGSGLPTSARYQSLSQLQSALASKDRSKASTCSYSMTDSELSERGLRRGKFVCKCPYCIAFRSTLPDEWERKKLADLGQLR